MTNTSEQSSLQDVISKALEGPEKMATPDLTKAQLIAVVQALVALLILLGAPPSDGVVTAAVAGISALVLIMLPTSDALIRRERARNAERIANAKRMLRAAPAGMLNEALEGELKRMKDASTEASAAPAATTPAGGPPAEPPSLAGGPPPGTTSPATSKPG